MYYISSSTMFKWGITDTSDGTEEFLREKDIVELIEKKKVHIYGVEYYNHSVECHILDIDCDINRDRLNDYIIHMSKVHNQWSILPIQDHLAECKVGSKLTIDYFSKDTAGNSHKGHTELVKIGVDLWHYEDNMNTHSGKDFDSQGAAWAVEVATVYSDMYTLKTGR